MKPDHSVFVTGMGIVSAFGTDLDIFWQKLCAGESAIKPLAFGDNGALPVKYAAQIDFDALVAGNSAHLPAAGMTEKRGVMGMIAAAKALEDAGLNPSPLSDNRIGIYGCSGVSELSEDDRHQWRKCDKNTLFGLRHHLSPYSGLRCGNDGMVTAIARRFSLSGPAMNVNAACAGGAHAIGLACQSIKRQETSIMLAGGADSVLNLHALVGLKLLGATAITEKWSDRLCRPFDKNRSGLVAGEGGAFLVLESEESALRRGAKIYAEIKGYGASLDAHKLTAPDPAGLGAENAIRQAIRDSGLRPEQIDYINAHGTSTPLNDALETAVIKRVFGSQPPLVSSTKSMLGHWIAAAGAIEAVATILTVKNQFILPTINLETPDPRCDLDYVPQQGRAAPVQNAITNSFGFGGINSCLVIGGYDGK
ncbi:beta-ketoacyl-[acyl-carrier-protein] synthase family protein [Xenorhabdus sp. IM139775]|uniref:beta-ketoacyl-[acyl-carrier-protein] synthase family protein n=1 Tax=Xenorhabdus sp. IM139775 TaxID=3025876 RepID=UPI002359D5D4|nr:beta-ketoacyl-[acyl-carrier-protein] synthase family protein [Xenorhabdus sp. IM139775]MDC9594860.1 beta-ketoacyl-[acyl-carrier-protein] synthase family protein [Xenorhabdus sp. IM139775]